MVISSITQTNMLFMVLYPFTQQGGYGGYDEWGGGGYGGYDEGYGQDTYMGYGGYDDYSGGGYEGFGGAAGAAGMAMVPMMLPNGQVRRW